MTQHTPGRLAWGHDNVATKVVWIMSEVGQWLAQFFHHQDDGKITRKAVTYQRSRQNAARFVTCWNFCDGVNSEELPAGGLKKLLGNTS